jgi:serine/threonine protein phosphatase PrpC
MVGRFIGSAVGAVAGCMSRDPGALRFVAAGFGVFIGYEIGQRIASCVEYFLGWTGPQFEQVRVAGQERTVVALGQQLICHGRPPIDYRESIDLREYTVRSDVDARIDKNNQRLVAFQEQENPAWKPKRYSRYPVWENRVDGAAIATTQGDRVEQQDLAFVSRFSLTLQGTSHAVQLHVMLDGHGSGSEHCVASVQNRYQQLLQANVEWRLAKAPWRKALWNGLTLAGVEMNRSCREVGRGTFANVALRVLNTLFVCDVGDCGALVVHEDGSHQRLSIPQKVENALFAKGLKHRGGTRQMAPGFVNWRCGGALIPTTRGWGNHNWPGRGWQDDVISGRGKIYTTEIRVRMLLIQGSDGLFENGSVAQVARLAHTLWIRDKRTLVQIAEELVHTAAHSSPLGECDNTTALVAELFPT